MEVSELDFGFWWPCTRPGLVCRPRQRPGLVASSTTFHTRHPASFSHFPPRPLFCRRAAQRNCTHPLPPENDRHVVLGPQPQTLSERDSEDILPHCPHTHTSDPLWVWLWAGSPSSVSPLDITALTFLDVTKKGQHPHWLSLPHRHSFIHLKGTLLLKKKKDILTTTWLQSPSVTGNLPSGPAEAFLLDEPGHT